MSPPPAAPALRWPRSWRAAWQRWWQARLPRTDALTLTQRNLYILPTRAGAMLGATVLVLLLGSINYQLNLGYLLTFLLAGCALASMVVGHSTLRGLQLHLLPPEPQFQGSGSRLTIELASRRATPRHGIAAGLQGARQHVYVDVPAGGSSQVQVVFSPQRRGLHAIPALQLHTRFPIGAFRVWTLWRPAAQVLVYPQPEAHPPPLPAGLAQAGSARAAQAASSGEFDGVRAYRRGDPLKLVVWKKAAKAGELVSRDSQQGERQRLWLTLQATGLAEREAALARLCAWVLQADRLALEYGLRLPGRELAPARGEAHRRRCLEALALC